MIVVVAVVVMIVAVAPDVCTSSDYLELLLSLLLPLFAVVAEAATVTVTSLRMPIDLLLLLLLMCCLCCLCRLCCLFVCLFVCLFA